MQHFLTRRWIAIHLLTLVIVAVCVSMATWQLRRLDHRRAENAQISSRSRLEPVDIQNLLARASAPPREVEAAAFRVVDASGTFDVSEQVILQSRTFEGRSGNHLLTPLVLASGEAVLVDRGWVPLPTDEAVLAESQPPSGVVAVRGALLPHERPGFMGVSDPPPGRVGAIPRVDLERLAGQLPYPVYPVYLRLQTQEPANTGSLPEPVPMPAADEGPHMEYALQWFLFAGTAFVIYIGLMRREHSRRPDDASDPEEPEPVAV